MERTECVCVFYTEGKEPLPEKLPDGEVSGVWVVDRGESRCKTEKGDDPTGRK